MRALCFIYGRYRKIADTNETAEIVEFIRFLERIIDRLQIIDKRAQINSTTKMLEAKIYNLMNVTPFIVIDAAGVTQIRDRLEISGTTIASRWGRAVGDSTPL